MIYSDGSIITVDDAGTRPEAVAVDDGRIVAVGSLADVIAFRGQGTQMVNLAGRTMVPGFVDSHGHVVMGGLQALAANLLAPPDGEVEDITGLQRVIPMVFLKKPLICPP